MIGLRRGLTRQQPTSNVARISLRSAHSDGGVTHRSASVSGAQGQRYISVPSPLFRSEVHRVKRGRAVAVTAGARYEPISYETSRQREFPRFRARGSGFEEPQRATSTIKGY
jgi:hypothetical protein